MKVKYFKDTDTALLEFSSGAVDETKEMSEYPVAHLENVIALCARITHALTLQRRAGLIPLSEVSMVGSSPPANAGVHFPPPLLYLAGFLIGLGLDRWHALPLTAGPSLGRTVAAVACLAAFAAVGLGAIITFRRARTTLIPNRPARALVTSGPYRVTRNPMYVGLAVLYVGAALLANSWWPLILLAVVLVVVDRAVIAREELYLCAAFPAEYAAYRTHVRRWL